MMKKLNQKTLKEGPQQMLYYHPVDVETMRERFRKYVKARKMVGFRHPNPKLSEIYEQARGRFIAALEREYPRFKQEYDERYA